MNIGKSNFFTAKAKTQNQVSLPLGVNLGSQVDSINFGVRREDLKLLIR